MRQRKINIKIKCYTRTEIDYNLGAFILYLHYLNSTRKSTAQQRKLKEILSRRGSAWLLNIIQAKAPEKVINVFLLTGCGT